MLYLLWQYLEHGGRHVPVLNPAALPHLPNRDGALHRPGSWPWRWAAASSRWMRSRQGKGQPIRADGVARHVIEKAGTPTMGGFMILAGLTVGTLIWADLSNLYVWVVLMVTTGYGALGFLDDYEKVTKQTTAGVSGRTKLLIQFAIALVATLLVVLFGVRSPETGMFSTSLAFPAFKNLLINLGWFYVIFGMVVIVGASNAVNLTTGWTVWPSCR